MIGTKNGSFFVIGRRIHRFFQNDYYDCNNTFGCDVWRWYGCYSVHEVLVASTLCGGISSTTVDSHIEKMVADFKGEVESRVNQQFTTFKPVEATHQVVELDLSV